MPRQPFQVLTKGGTLMPDLAPVEYIVIDSRATGSTARSSRPWSTSSSSARVRILDLVFVKKDDDGSVDCFEFFDQLDELGDFGALDGDAGDVLSDDDVLALADDIPPGSSALFDRVGRPVGCRPRSSGPQRRR